MYYNTTTLSLNDPAGRIEFVRQLYNLLCVESDATQAEDTQAAVSELNGKIRRLPMKSMYTKVDKSGKKRRRREDDDNHTGTGEDDGGDHAQLRTHGYEVKPNVVMDASGGEWGPLFKVLATFFDLFAMLMPNPRSRIIFLLCIDPWTRRGNSSRRRFGRIRTSSRCSDSLIPFH